MKGKYKGISSTSIGAKMSQIDAKNTDKFCDI